MDATQVPPDRPGIAEIIRPHHLGWTADRGIACGCGWTPVNELFANGEWAEHVAEVIERATACHVSPLPPEHYCGECGAINSDPAVS